MVAASDLSVWHLCNAYTLTSTIVCISYLLAICFCFLSCRRMLAPQYRKIKQKKMLRLNDKLLALYLTLHHHRPSSALHTYICPSRTHIQKKKKEKRNEQETYWTQSLFSNLSTIRTHLFSHKLYSILTSLIASCIQLAYGICNVASDIRNFVWRMNKKKLFIRERNFSGVYCVLFHIPTRWIFFFG